MSLVFLVSLVCKESLDLRYKPEYHNKTLAAAAAYSPHLMSAGRQRGARTSWTTGSSRQACKLHRVFFRHHNALFTSNTSCSRASVFPSQGSKGERGPIGVPGAQGLSGTKGDKVCGLCDNAVTQSCILGAVFTHSETLE